MTRAKTGRVLLALLLSAVSLLGLFAPSALAADSIYRIYYTESDKLYRSRNDGKGEAELLATNTNPGRRCIRSGNFLVGLSSSGSLLRSDLSKAPHAQCDTLDSSTGAFDVRDGYIYYTKRAPDNSSAYRLYRMKADTDASKSGYANSNKYHAYEKELASNLDNGFLQFKILDGYIYYTAKKDGRELWIARKKQDGSGSVKWICAGSLESQVLITTTPENLYILVNTNPKEDQYSTECMVAYQVNRKSGKAKALNAKNPVDYNASGYGGWAGQVYYYNTGIEMVRAESSFDEFPSYVDAKGYGISMSGRRFVIDEKGVIAMVKTTGDTYVYSNREGKVYACTIKSGKVSNKRQIKGVSNIQHIRNMKKNGKRATTLMAGQSGTYLLNDNLKVTKLTGVNWDIVYLFDDIDGILYSNAGDEGRLYWMSADGKTNRRISNVKPGSVVYVEAVQ